MVRPSTDGGVDVGPRAPRTRVAGMLATALLGLGCPAEAINVNIKLLKPLDESRLGATDNVSITLSPDGFVNTFATDGPDFSLEVELEPDETERELGVFMAQGESLIAYGQTPPFAFRVAAGAGIQVLLAYPESLSTLPIPFDLPDASTVAAAAVGRGIVALGGDGSTAFLDRYTFDLETAATLTEVPALDDGVFVGDAAGGVVRLSWAGGIAGQRFDVVDNTWTPVVFEGADAAVPRPGASHVRIGTDALLVIGGGDRTDSIRVNYGTDSNTPSALLGSAVLDAPRHNATAVSLDFPDGPIAVVVGGDDTALPRVVVASSPPVVTGPADAWTGLRCVKFDLAGAEATAHQLLCAGGLRPDEPTADALLVTIDVSQAPAVVELPEFLPGPMADVLWLQDDAAVYAQGDGRWVRIDRGDLTVTEPPAAPARARGGTGVLLDTGFTIVIGGTDVAGAPTNVWQVFAPGLPP